MGKLIVLEGVDGSGKSTQMKLLRARLEGADRRYISFPRYEEASSFLVRMYLGGKIRTSPDEVNAYAASTFFAADRYISFMRDWGGFYERGGTILTDRYTTSNAIHQASKLDEGARAEYWRWLYDYEFNRLGLPKPDLVLYLNVPFDTLTRRISARSAHCGARADIHESDTEYLRSCVKCGFDAAKHYGWTLVDGTRPAEQIQRDLIISLGGILT
ncbi:MAG: deoxynucleoside kinase [Oscillospiraceae bacterium]|jgi:dTMP kinase|nr:deoxynucleoside kinase [Oscillospiraceae bacterium]